jgi:hypothetical protein
MSYTSGGLFEIVMKSGTGTTNLDLTSTGDKSRVAPGLTPFIIRGVAVVLNAIPADAGQVDIDKRVTYGSDTGRVTDSVTAIKMLTTHAAGNVIYKTGLNVKVSPGEEVVVAVGDASASVNGAQVTLLCEASHETPANITAMKLTT